MTDSTLDHDENKRLNRLRRLIRASRYQDALESIRSLNLQQEENAPLIGETIRLLLLLNETENALKCFLVLNSLPERLRRIEEEVLVRLEICIGRQVERSRLQVVPATYSWLHCFKEDLEDRIHVPPMTGCNVVNNARTYYHFGLECPCCGQEYSLCLVGSLLVHKEFLCPVCLARQLVTAENIRDYVTRTHPALTGDVIYPSTLAFLELRGRLDSDQSLSPVARQLSQDTSFAINQLIINEEMSSAVGEG